MQYAKPALLEPIMNVEIQAPVEYAGDLMGDLNSRRGRIAGMETRGSSQFETFGKHYFFGVRGKF